MSENKKRNQNYNYKKNNKPKEAGEYKHFKGNKYTVYGVAKNELDEEFILYKSSVDGKYWIREYNMFFEMVNKNGNEKTKRFEKIEDIDGFNYEEQISNLIKIITSNTIIIKNSENQDKNYVIAKINSKNKEIDILEINDDYSNYLTDFQICQKMGYTLMKVDNIIYLNNYNYGVEKNKFQITQIIDGENHINLENFVKKNINPCSLDLHISKNIFYKTRKNKIDLSSLSNMYSFEKLWKKIKIDEGKGLVLKPNESIITCTDEIIKIPNDCAGKIEIKSTYARLSLSVTASDFCNPGWEGHFPLQIKNNSSNKIIIYPQTKMLQILLIPIKSKIVNEYNGTYMYDDGTPKKFWIELKKSKNNLIEYELFEEIAERYYDDLKKQERFVSIFPKFFEKYKKKHDDKNSKKSMIKAYNEFTKSEKQKYENIDFIYKYGKFIVSIISSLITLIIEKDFKITIYVFLLCLALIGIIAYIIKKNLNSYCTTNKLKDR